MARTLLRRLSTELLDEVPGDDAVVDLATGGPDGSLWSQEQRDAARASVIGADLLVVASPTLRGSYSGLLKLFVDGLPDRAMAEAVAIPVMIAPTPRHALVAEIYLRPVLVELGASCPSSALFALENRLANPGAVCASWLERSRPALARALPRPHPEGPPTPRRRPLRTIATPSPPYRSA